MRNWDMEKDCVFPYILYINVREYILLQEYILDSMIMRLIICYLSTNDDVGMKVYLLMVPG